MHDEVLLGSVALEPNRWGTLTGRREATVALSPWMDGVMAAGFDGVELWEPHLVDEGEAARVLGHALPIPVLSSYSSLDDSDALAATADRATRAASRAVKFNVGEAGSDLAEAADRVAAWLELLPAGVALLCECHEGTAAAEDHPTTARFLAAAGPPERVQAIVHTHEGAERVTARFAAYGDRIRHAHVNHLDAGTAPPLVDVDDLGDRVAHLRSLGFRGSWTLEFVHGLLTERDEPEALLAQAAADLPVLRAAIT